MLALRVRIGKEWGMQGSSRPDRELLDAAALCGHLLGPGSVHALLAAHRRTLFPDEMFADLFPSGRGRPSVPADVVATVMVLQALEAKSDRDAVRALERDIAWKAAAGLALTDEGFHPTVLTLWRNKLRASGDPQRIFNAVRAVVAETGVITGRNRRVLDSTVFDDAVQRQDTITMLVTQIRRVRKLIPELASVWVREHNLEGGRPPVDWDDPADIDRVVSELVDDANELVWAAEDLQTNGLVLTTASAGRWRCWPSWPARTSSPVTGRGSGGSPVAPRLTGSFPPSTRNPVMFTRPSTRIEMATRPTWLSSLTPA